MKKLILFVFIGFLFTGLTYGQDQVNLKASGSGDVTKGKSRGADPNIKVTKHVNASDMETLAIQPAEKGGEASSRGSGSGTCYVSFDNWTSWYLDCYVDGSYEGYMAPWGSGNVTTGSRTTCLHVVAEFGNGDQISWGPECRSCDHNDIYEIEVYPTLYNWSIE